MLYLLFANKIYVIISNMKKMILGLCGPAGAGKGFFVEELQNQGYPIERIVSYTTRPMGENEKEGVHYYYVTKEKFNEMKESGDFFESGCWHECYGTPKSEFSRIQESGKVPVLEIGHRGMMKMKEILKETDWELQPVGILPGELSYNEILEKHPEMQISFNIETGTPEIPDQSDRMVLINEYKNLLRDRMKYRSRESDEEIEKKIENSSDILEFFLSGQAKENGFKMVSNEMWNKENPVKELLLRAKFLNEFRPGINEIKMR